MTRLAAAAARRLRRHADLAAPLGLAALTLLLFRAVVFSGRVFFDRDIHLFWYTQVECLVRIVTAPAWPLWDPYTSFGQPLLANPESQILYPPTWLNLLVRPWVYFTLFVVGHVWFTGYGAHRLARALGLARGAGLVAAGVWISSGPLLSLVNVNQHFTGACWMPWVLLAVERAARDPRARTAAAWALAQSLQIFAGSGDMCALTIACSALLLARHVDWRSGRATARLALHGLLAVGLTTALAAVLWWPVLELVSRSARHELPQVIRTYWSVHPLSLLELLFPVSARTFPLNASWRSILYEGREPFLYSLYLGLPVVALLGAALLARDRRLLRTLGLGLLGALLVALGRHAPFYDVVVTLLPPLQIFRYPQKAMVPVALLTALLAGLGFEAWTTWAGTRRRWLVVTAWLPCLLASASWVAVVALLWRPALFGPWLAAPPLPEAVYAQVLHLTAGRLAATSALATAAALAVLLRRRPAILGGSIVAACLIADLVFQHQDLHPTTTRDFYLYRPPALQRIEQSDHSRLYVYDYIYAPQGARRHLGQQRPYAIQRGPQGWSRDELKWLVYRDALVPPIAGAWGRESSFDMDFRGLYPQALVELVQGLLASEGTPAHLRLLQLGAVSQVVTLHTAGLEDLEPVATLPGLGALPLHLYRVPDPRPRCFVADGVRVAVEGEALETLAAPAFDPAREVLVLKGHGAPRSSDPTFAGSCTIVELRPDRVRLNVRTSRDAHVVLVDLYDPGWRVTVDGAPATLVQVNLAFRGVAVRPGVHEVAFRYRPRGVIYGAPLSLGGLLLVGILLRRRAADSPGARSLDDAQGGVAGDGEDPAGGIELERHARAVERLPPE